MGIQGTEVAKENSDIIILDDNFASVVKVSKIDNRFFLVGGFMLYHPFPLEWSLNNYFTNFLCFIVPCKVTVSHLDCMVLIIYAPYALQLAYKIMNRII